MKKKGTVQIEISKTMNKFNDAQYYPYLSFLKIHQFPQDLILNILPLGI